MSFGLADQTPSGFNYPNNLRYPEMKPGEIPAPMSRYNQGYSNEYNSNPIVSMDNPNLPSSSKGWTCARCRSINFSSQSKCINCGIPRPVVENDHYRNSDSTYYPQDHRQDTWTCMTCNATNPSYANACSVCRTPKPYDLYEPNYNRTSRYDYPHDNDIHKPSPPLKYSDDSYYMNRDPSPSIRHVTDGKSTHDSAYSRQPAGYYDITRGKAGDWVCDRCGEVNFSYRVVCRKCSASKPAVITDPRSIGRYRNQVPSHNRSRSRSIDRHHNYRRRSPSNDNNSNNNRRYADSSYHSTSRSHHRDRFSRDYTQPIHSDDSTHKDVNTVELQKNTVDTNRDILTPPKIEQVQEQTQTDSEITSSVTMFKTKFFYCSSQCSDKCQHTTVHVYHLPSSITTSKLVELFSKLGPLFCKSTTTKEDGEVISNYDIEIINKDNTISSTEAIIHYQEPLDAHYALVYFNNYQYEDCTLYVCMNN